jgi:hypothetical protein
MIMESTEIFDIGQTAADYFLNEGLLIPATMTVEGRGYSTFVANTVSMSVWAAFEKNGHAIEEDAESITLHDQGMAVVKSLVNNWEELQATRVKIAADLQRYRASLS